MGFGDPASVSRLLFWSDLQPTVVLPAVAADIALPSVAVDLALQPTGTTIKRVLAGMSFSKKVDSSGGANAVVGNQEIQVRSDAPGTFRDAISMPDNVLATASGATEGGLLVVGNHDIAAEVVATDTYEFQWTSALVDGASLTLHDVQTLIIVEFE